jgi:hypothetical protein
VSASVSACVSDPSVSDARAVLLDCSPAQLVRSIDHMRGEIERRRGAAGVTAVFQVGAVVDMLLLLVGGWSVGWWW